MQLDPIADPQQASNVLEFLERFGFPVSLLIVILWGMVRTARWVAPRVDSLVKRHERLLDTLEEELKNHGVILSNMEEHQAHVLDCLRAINEKIENQKT